MGDRYETVKVAAVQAASVFLDRDRLDRQGVRLIREAGRNGARVIGFPGRIHPGAPGLVPPPRRDRGDRQPAVGRACSRTRSKFPGLEIAALSAAARDADAYVVIGAVRENSEHHRHHVQHPALYRPDGALIGKHQKIMPTVGERLVHTGGHGDTFGAFADRIRADERADLRRELQSARGVRADRRGHAHSRDELAQSFSDQRRSDAEPGRRRLAGLRADEQGLRDFGLRHGRRSA